MVSSPWLIKTWVTVVFADPKRRQGVQQGGPTPVAKGTLWVAPVGPLPTLWTA